MTMLMLTSWISSLGFTQKKMFKKLETKKDKIVTHKTHIQHQKDYINICSPFI